MKSGYLHTQQKSGRNYGLITSTKTKRNEWVYNQVNVNIFYKIRRIPWWLCSWVNEGSAATDVQYKTLKGVFESFQEQVLQALNAVVQNQEQLLLQQQNLIANQSRLIDKMDELINKLRFVNWIWINNLLFLTPQH